MKYLLMKLIKDLYQILMIKDITDDGINILTYKHKDIPK